MSIKSKTQVTYEEKGNSIAISFDPPIDPEVLIAKIDRINDKSSSKIRVKDI